MRAVVLCAGFGTRLAPLTDRIPKPLVPVANRPVLDIVLDRLKEVGIRGVGVNLHHKAAQLQAHLERRDDLAIRTVFEPEILETGGGIAHFRDWADEDGALLVHNADIVTDVDITRVMADHEESGADVTLALVDDPRFNVVGIDDDGRITDIRGSEPRRRYTLCGIYVLSQRFLRRLEPGRKASVVDAIRAHMVDAPHSVRGIRPLPHTYWRDLGHVASYLDLHREILSGDGPRLPGLVVPSDGILLAGDVAVGPNTCLERFVAVGAGCRLGRDVRLTDCVVLAGTQLRDGFEASGSVILDEMVIAA